MLGVSPKFGHTMLNSEDKIRYSKKKIEVKRRMLAQGFARIEVIEMLLEDLNERELDSLL